jgi:hypothetical protein
MHDSLLPRLVGFFGNFLNSWGGPEMIDGLHR